jgi:predicted ATPase
MLLERDAELAGLEAQWRRARAGSGSVALVAGESGIGKTALVRAFTAGVEGRVAWGACDPLHTPRPLGPFHDAAAELGGRVPELLAAGAFSHDVFTAVLEELAARP